MLLAFLDIKDVFYCTLVHKIHQKILKFLLKVKARQFNAMHNGYVDAMPVFNKVLKPLFAHETEQGLSSVVYVDYTLLGGDTFEECQDNNLQYPYMLKRFGFLYTPREVHFYSNTRNHISRISH